MAFKMRESIDWEIPIEWEIWMKKGEREMIDWWDFKNFRVEKSQHNEEFNFEVNKVTQL